MNPTFVVLVLVIAAAVTFFIGAITKLATRWPEFSFQLLGFALLTAALAVRLWH